MADDYARTVADALVAQLREGTAPWQKPWRPGTDFLPYNPTTGDRYHGMNAMWLLVVGSARGYDDTRWMTYRQAQAEDAQVRKGEKGTVIQFWKWCGEEPARDGDGRPVVDEAGRTTKQLVEYARPRVFSAVVFNATQIDGLPAAVDRAAGPEWQRHARAEAVLANSGAALRHQAGDRAYYDPRADQITLPERAQFATADGYYRVALHELGHWTGHPSRLDRDLAHPFGSVGYAREELRAEIASLMVGAELGTGHDPGQHAAYVGNWIQALQDDQREVFRAAADAEKIAVMVRGFEQAREHAAVDERAPARATPEPRPAVVSAVVPATERLNVPDAPARADPPGVATTLAGAIGQDLDRWLDRHATELARERPDLAPESEAYASALAGAVNRSYVDGLEERVSTLLNAMIAPSSADEQRDPARWTASDRAARDPEWVGGERTPLDAVFRRDLERLSAEVTRHLRVHQPNAEPGSATHLKVFVDAVTRDYYGALADHAATYAEQWLERGAAAARAAGSERDALPNVTRSPQPTSAQSSEVAMPSTAERVERVYLAVPYADKEQAKALGARWDRDAKAWYAPPGADLAPLAAWRPGHAVAADSPRRDPHAEFGAALHEAGLRLDAAPVMDGQLHRVPVEGDKQGAKSGGYVGFLDGHPAGYINNYRTGVAQTWKLQQPTSALAAADRARLAAEAAEHRQARAAARAERAEATVATVGAYWSAASPLDGDANSSHPYLDAKGVGRWGELRVSAAAPLTLPAPDPDGVAQQWSGPGQLLVPARDVDGTLRSVQSIDAHGRKSFPRGGQVTGAFAMLNAEWLDPSASELPLIVVEGYATGATLAAETRAPVAVAFHAGNLAPVARALHARYPERNLVLAGDDDHHRPRERGPDGRPKPNVGREKAKAAAAEVGGVAIFPRFAAQDRGTDWNDLRQEKGAAEFLRQFRGALASAERQLLATREAAGPGRELTSAAPALAPEEPAERVHRREGHTLGDRDTRQVARRPARRH